MVTWMRRHQRGMVFGIVGMAALMVGLFFYALVLDAACCAPPPSEAQDDTFELTGKIVFESDPTDFTGHFTHIAVMNANGTDYQALTGYFEEGELENYRVGSPVWSADGEQIAFVAVETAKPSRLYMMNADGDELTLLAESETGYYSAPSWSPDGERIVYSFRDGDDSDLYVMDIATKDIARLTDNEVDDSSPDWSPDGEWIVFNEELEGDFEVFVMQADGSEIRQLTDNENRDVYPVWSPDGGQIAFVSDESGEEAIYVLTLEGEEVTLVATAPTLLPGRLAWSPDGQYIAYGALVPYENVDPDIEVHPVTGLYVVRIADGQVVQLDYVFVGWNAGPSWVE